jgi:hypothetical protein
MLKSKIDEMWKDEIELNNNKIYKNNNINNEINPNSKFFIQPLIHQNL